MATRSIGPAVLEPSAAFAVDMMVAELVQQANVSLGKAGACISLPHRSTIGIDTISHSTSKVATSSLLAALSRACRSVFLDFLDIWSSHFSQLGYPSELNQTTGWQVYVDGKPFTGDFHTIAL